MELAHKISVNYVFTAKQIEPLVYLANGNEALVRKALDEGMKVYGSGLTFWVAEQYILANNHHSPHQATTKLGGLPYN